MNLEVEGYFWLPEEPDRKVRGRLIWSPEIGGSLALEGLLTPGMQVAGQADELRGQTLDGLELILLNTFVRQAHISASLSQQWHINQAFLGSDTAEMATETLALEADELEAFVATSGLAISSTDIRMSSTPGAG